MQSFAHGAAQKPVFLHQISKIKGKIPEVALLLLIFPAQVPEKYALDVKVRMIQVKY